MKADIFTKPLHYEAFEKLWDAFANPTAAYPENVILPRELSFSTTPIDASHSEKSISITVHTRYLSETDNTSEVKVRLGSSSHIIYSI